MSWLALDVGGANIKAANAQGYARTRGFALWKNPHRLEHELRELLADAPPSSHLAITMTGELADCFCTKQEGVEAILDAVVSAAPDRHQRVYLTDGRLVTPIAAKQMPQLVAASNWHALASYATRLIDSKLGLLVDMGSTTTDLIPLMPHEVAAAGTTDTQRLCNHELVYTGVERTPVCAVAREVPYRGQLCRVAQEWFATMKDVYQVLGHLAEEVTSTDTADGRPATKPHSRARLGRMICADETEFNHRDAGQMAVNIAKQQRDQIAMAIHRRIEAMSAPPAMVVISGKGEFLIRRALAKLKMDFECIALSKKIGRRASLAAPAFALATLCEERG